MKLNEAPEPTRSMHIAMEDLQLKKLDVVHGGDRTFELAPGIRALAASELTTALRPMR